MRLTASKAALLGACAYPFRDGVPCVEERGRSAINGDRFHVAIAPCVGDPTKEPTDPGRSLKWLEARLEHAMTWIRANRQPGWRAEVAYAYNPQTGAGRILGYNIDRKYEEHGLLPGELAGTADIAWLGGDTVVVYDWKTGRAIGDSVWAQMEWLCLFAARATGAWHARAVVLHATDYGIIPLERPYDDVELWRIAEQIRIDVAAIDDAWPVTGTHCDACYCPARAGCDLYQINRKVPHDEVA